MQMRWIVVFIVFLLGTSVTAHAEQELSVLAEEVPVTFLNVEKVWIEDSESDRPPAVWVQLLENGAPCGEPVELNAENGWTHTWYGLDGRRTWSAVETEVPEGYTARQIHVGHELKIINTRKAVVKNEVYAMVPRTGDPILHMLVGMAVSAAALLVLFVVRPSQKKK